jgi:hypothetical protein
MEDRRGAKAAKVQKKSREGRFRQKDVGQKDGIGCEVAENNA